MARIDESRPFIPVNIAVLTVSDTRDEETDTSGDLLAGRVSGSVGQDRDAVAEPHSFNPDDSGAFRKR